MRLVIQRVGKTSVVINNSKKREIEKGLLVYLGVKKDEDKSKIEKAVSKLLKLRFFENEEGKLKKNIQDIDGSIMLISNFSLYATAKKRDYIKF